LKRDQEAPECNGCLFPFQQMGGEGVPQAVKRSDLFNFSLFERVFKYMLGGACDQMFAWLGPAEKPFVNKPSSTASGVYN